MPSNPSCTNKSGDLDPLEIVDVGLQTHKRIDGVGGAEIG